MEATGTKTDNLALPKATGRADLSTVTRNNLVGQLYAKYFSQPGSPTPDLMGDLVGGVSFGDVHASKQRMWETKACERFVTTKHCATSTGKQIGTLMCFI